MKKLFSFILIAVLCILPLTACSTDFSATIEGKMDEIYESVKDIAEPYLKQDEKYSTSEDSVTNTNEASTDESALDENSNENALGN